MGIFSEAMEKSGKIVGSESARDPFFSVASIQQHLLGGFLDAVSSLKERPVLIGVTSSQAGEGVSTVSRMLAYALCYSNDKPTFLIDANFIDPSLHIKENFSQTPGLTEMLLNGKTKEPQDIVFSREGLPLRFVASGRTPESPALMYNHQDMDSFLEKVRSLASYAIFDLPPVHASPEMILLARKLDGVIFVVRAHHTQVKSVALAVDKIRKSGVTLLGGILNGKKYFIPKWLYERL
ncbi:MAG: tyrosine-protein kinase family protein [Thermodesulforhabdaceae bacterium]